MNLGLLDFSSLVGWAPRVVLDAPSSLVWGLSPLNIRVSCRNGVNPVPSVLGQGLAQVFILEVCLLGAMSLLGGVGGIGGDEGGHLGEVGKLGQCINKLARVVLLLQGPDDPLHTGVEVLNLGVEPLQDVVLALQGGHEVEDSKVDCKEWRDSYKEEAADVKGGASLSSPYVAFPDGDDIADQRGLVAHLEEGRGSTEDEAVAENMLAPALVDLKPTQYNSSGPCLVGKARKLCQFLYSHFCPTIQYSVCVRAMSRDTLSCVSCKYC